MDTPQAMTLRADIPGPDQVSTSLTTPRSTQVTMGAPLSTSLIQDADGFTILGGQFTSAAGDVTVHNHYPHPDLGLASISMNIVDETFSESEIYCSQLLRQKRGFPLYDPEPRQTLPQEYQQSGIAIGDVGRITPEGAFDFFFNIYLPADHPINDNDVPENFCPLPRYRSKDLYNKSYFAGDHVSTPSVQRLDPDVFPGGDFLLSCRAPQGAVLALPHGSHLQKLENLENIRKYVAAHAESWFKYINGPRGRGLDGSLYLVTGCEKASSWGLASFHTVDNTFQLSFKPTAGASGYRWRGNPARKKYHDPSPMHELNQTMFIHGLSISLGTGIWARMFETVQIREISDNGSRSGSESGKSTSSSQGSLFSPVLGFFGGGAATDGTNAGSRRHVVLSDLPPISQICHPGELLNNYILEKHSHAAVVMSHDDDWCEILGDDDPASQIRTVPEFLQRIEAQYEIVEKDGSTFLQAPQIKDELMEIDCADLQQAQSNSQYLRESPPKLDPAVEGVRAAERVSTKNLDGLQRRQSLQDSPKSRISTTTSLFAQAPATPSCTPAYQTSLKRGRKRNDNLPPNRDRDVQRAFRARRAAHLQALEDRVAELEEENSCLRQALNLPAAIRPPLGKGPTGKHKPKTVYDTHNHHALTNSSRESSSADSPSSMRESLSPLIVSATLPPRSSVQEIESGTGVRRQTIVMTEEVPRSPPLPPISAPPTLQSKMAPYSSPVSHPSSRSLSLTPMYNSYNPNDRSRIPTYPRCFEVQQQQQQQQRSYSYSSPQQQQRPPYSPAESPVHEQVQAPRPVTMGYPPQRRSTGDIQTLCGHYPHTPLPPTPLGIRLPSPPCGLQDQQHPQEHDVHTMHNHSHHSHSQLDPHAHHRPAYTADGRIIS